VVGIVAVHEVFVDCIADGCEGAVAVVVAVVVVGSGAFWTVVVGLDEVGKCEREVGLNFVLK